MNKRTWFTLWIMALVILLILGGMLVYTGLSDYLNGVRLPHHSKNLAQSIFAMLC
ncbi:MAG: hypothetical protein IJA59_01305 [Clostridia bacterium]|nr:hypothetical protein [Clostridia bacterium]